MRFNYSFKIPALRPDITPLIDVILLLLIFFMIGSQFVSSTAIKVKLPKAEVAGGNTESVVIAITRKGSFYFGGKPVKLSDIEILLKHMKGESIDIEADKETSFKNVIAVWDMARKYGLKEINIRTVKA